MKNASFLFRNSTSLITALLFSVGLATASGAAANQQAGTSAAPIQLAHANDIRAGHGHGWRSRHGRRHAWRHIMKELDLSDAQRDAIFKVRHSHAPQLRQYRMTLRSARRALRELSFSTDYTEQRAGQLAEELAKAKANVATLRAASRNRIFRLLSASQRSKLLERLKQHRRV